MPAHTRSRDAAHGQEHQAAAEALSLREEIDEARSRIERAREALEPSRANEWGRHLDQVGESLRDAARSAVFAAESMSARHEAAGSAFRNELEAERVLARQQGREERVADRLETLAERQIEEVDRLGELVSGMRQASLSFAQDVLAHLEEDAGQPHAQWLQDAQDRLQRFKEEWRDVVATGSLWDGRFSDVEAVKRTWERAAEGQKADAKGYEAARSSFWELVNAALDDDAREVRRLLDRAGVEWQEGRNAPLLAVSSTRLEQMREAAALGDEQMAKWVEADRRARTITIDHVAGKGTHPELAIEASNLRFLAQSDNSARGKWYDLADRRSLDFRRSDEWQAANEESRNRRRGERADESHERFEAMAVALAQQRLEREKGRAAAEHQKELNEAVGNRERKARELRDSSLRPLNGESEELRRSRQEGLLKELDRFLNGARRQIEALQESERRLHERQQQELLQVRQSLADEESTPAAREALERIRGLEERFAAERDEIEGVRRDMDTRRNADERRMLDAIYLATSIEAQEERVKRAFERQQQTQQEQERRLDELARKRHAHD